MTLDEYLSLITSEHRGKEKFEATVTAGVGPLVKVQDVARGFPADFDIDTAVGAQLDDVGEWIGRSRRIDIPLVGVYFAWDDTAQTGWDSGVWKGEFDPDSGLTNLPDDSYRRLLKAKIAANSWDGTIPGAYAIWASAFDNSSFLIIQDNQDMSMIVGIAGQRLNAVDQSLLLGGYIPLKPAGVRVLFYAITPEEGLLFAWDVEESGAVAGWDIGQWAVELVP